MLGSLLLVFFVIFVSGIQYGKDMERRKIAEEINIELQEMRDRMAEIKAWVEACDPVAMHQTLDPGWVMIQLLCPDSIGPRPEK